MWKEMFEWFKQTSRNILFKPAHAQTFLFATFLKPMQDRQRIWDYWGTIGLPNRGNSLWYERDVHLCVSCWWLYRWFCPRLAWCQGKAYCRHPLTTTGLAVLLQTRQYSRLITKDRWTPVQHRQHLTTQLVNKCQNPCLQCSIEWFVGWFQCNKESCTRQDLKVCRVK